MGYVRLALFTMLWLLGNAAHANDAAECIQVGEDIKLSSRTLKNTCNREVIVFWCHAYAGSDTNSTACDPTKKLYKQNSLLKENEVKSNRYALPLGAKIHFGACFGSYFSFELLNGEGAYFCKPEREASEAAKPRMIHTVGRALEEEACEAASKSAAPYGHPSECICEQRGKINICRVASDFESGGADAIFVAMKKKLREFASCNSELRKDCVRPAFVSIGRRG